MMVALLLVLQGTIHGMELALFTVGLVWHQLQGQLEIPLYPMGEWLSDKLESPTWTEQVRVPHIAIPYCLQHIVWYLVLGVL